MCFLQAFDFPGGGITDYLSKLLIIRYMYFEKQLKKGIKEF
jgi:hypothetical protein